MDEVTNAGANEAPRLWAGQWQRFVFPSVWLVYLGQVAQGVHRHSSGVAEIAGYAVVVAFAVVYVLAVPTGWREPSRRYWVLYALAVALSVAGYPLAHEPASAFCVYLAVLTIIPRARWTGPVVLALTLWAALAPVIVPGWKNEVDWGSGIAVLLASFAVFGFFHIIQGNRELAAARAEVARLAAENERSRIARDLHDLLGHSLTTITVKAGLARRLAERGEAERSFTEIREVEQLSRRTLGDVRAALTGELATAREVLRAAGVVAELPGSVDAVDSELSEVFGWVVREGITNVVRHAHAEHCRVVLGPRRVEIIDDGHGDGMTGAGNGLTGLRERLSAVGGTLTATHGFVGFTLRAEVPVLRPVPVTTRTDPASVLVEESRGR